MAPWLALFYFPLFILCAAQYNHAMSTEDVFGSQILELRRGAIVLAVLSQLDSPQYGYGLLQQLGRGKIVVDAGTLYPLLRRLERQGVLESSWDETESRPRKYYQMSAEGLELYTQLLSEWRDLVTSIEYMTKEGA